ncbi:hypothetical protein VTK56DRAFT_7282 [Thermocarpiscus australiensis]
MPENPKDAIYTNQFRPWMTNVCRVLAARRIPSRLGYPAIPDAWFTIKGRGRGSSVIGIYGGLAFLPQIWDTVVAQWENDRNRPLTLQARTAPERGRENLRISDRWHFFLPGFGGPYEKQYILHNEVDDVKAVRKRIVSLLKYSISADSFYEMHSLKVHLAAFWVPRYIPDADITVISRAGQGLSAAPAIWSAL